MNLRLAEYNLEWEKDKMIKKYLLFCFPRYYPHGGICDFVGSFNSIKEALIFVLEDKDNTYYQIVTHKTLKKVREGRIEDIKEKQMKFLK